MLANLSSLQVLQVGPDARSDSELRIGSCHVASTGRRSLPRECHGVPQFCSLCALCGAMLRFRCHFVENFEPLIFKFWQVSLSTFALCCTAFLGLGVTFALGTFADASISYLHVDVPSPNSALITLSTTQPIASSMRLCPTNKRFDRDGQ